MCWNSFQLRIKFPQNSPLGVVQCTKRKPGALDSVKLTRAEGGDTGTIVIVIILGKHETESILSPGKSTKISIELI